MSLRCVLAVLVALVPVLAAAPAAAQFMSAQDEARIGAEQHPKILEAFGGAYPDPKVTDYVERVGGKLVRVSDTPNQRFTFTVLNSSMVNAFALPGGYVYVTRGLLALANNEAELAGVLAHEMGHVVAHHGAERYNQSMMAQILGLGAALVLGDAQVAQMLGAVAAPVLASHSREHELEADRYGVTYLSRAGYDPLAMAVFLRHLGAQSALEAEILGRGDADQFNLLATHPRTPQRVEQAIQQAHLQPVAAPDINSIPFLQAIDGLAYDGDRVNGFVKEGVFVHPARRFRFRLPDGFRPVMADGASMVAMGPENSFVKADWVERGGSGSMGDYIRRVWAPEAALSGLQTLTVNGLDAATATTRAETKQGQVDARLVAIRLDASTVHRFMFVTPPALTARHDASFRNATYSFRRLTVGEADAAQPLRVRMTRAGPNDTVETMAARLPYDSHRVARFRVLNGLPEDRRIVAGQFLKTIVDPTAGRAGGGAPTQISPSSGR